MDSSRLKHTKASLIATVTGWLVIAVAVLSILHGYLTMPKRVTVPTEASQPESSPQATPEPQRGIVSEKANENRIKPRKVRARRKPISQYEGEFSGDVYGAMR